MKKNIVISALTFLTLLGVTNVYADDIKSKDDPTASSSKLGTRSCTGRYQTGGSWNTPGTVIWEGNLGDVTTGVGNNSAEKKCTKKMQDKALAENMTSLASSACNNGIANGTKVYAASKAGTIPGGGTDQLMGTLVSTAAITKKMCPSPSVANSTNQPGETQDVCKQRSASCNTLENPPANGTQIGTWGFVWQGAVWQFIQPTTTIVSPAQCHF